MGIAIDARAVVVDRRRYLANELVHGPNCLPDHRCQGSWYSQKYNRHDARDGSSCERCSLHSLTHCLVCSASSQADPPISPLIYAGHGRHRAPKLRQPTPSLTRRMPGAGIRTNCLNAYPHPGGFAVDFAVDYLIEYLAPLIFGSLYPKFGNPLVATGFPFALENPDLFLAMVTLSQAHVDTLSRPDGKPSLESLTFWGNTVSKMKAKMNDPETCADDAIILANIYIMGAAARFQWQEAVNTFYLGVKRMVAIRGGLDKLGLNGYVKGCILSQEALGLATVSEDSDSQTPSDAKASTENLTSARNTSIGSSAVSIIEYPTHPFPPRVCEALARLPSGLVDLAVHGYMCTDLIYTAERIYHFASQDRPILLEHGPGQYLKELEKLAKRLSTPARYPMKRNIERLLCLGFTILCLELFTAMTMSLVNATRWKLIKKLCLHHEQPDDIPAAESRLELELKAWFLILASKSGSEEGNFSFDGQRVEDVLFDYLLDPPSSSQGFTKPEFAFARRWRSKHGLRAVLAKFYLDDHLEAELHSVWKKHMQRKQFVVSQQDVEGISSEVAKHDSEEDKKDAEASLLLYITNRSRIAGRQSNDDSASSITGF